MMIRWIKAFFAWRVVRDTGVWIYLQNSVTGERKAFRYVEAYQPCDHVWLRQQKTPGG